MSETYKINIAGLERELPLCPVSDTLDIAAFVMFGDTISRDSHISKAICPTDVTFGGSFTEIRFQQPLKAESPIEFSDGGSSKAVPCQGESRKAQRQACSDCGRCYKHRCVADGA